MPTDPPTDDVLAELETREPLVTTGAELSRELDHDKPAILDALRILEHAGDAASKRTGANALAWWATSRARPPRDREAGERESEETADATDALADAETRAEPRPASRPQPDRTAPTRDVARELVETVDDTDDPEEPRVDAVLAALELVEESEAAVTKGDFIAGPAQAAPATYDVPDPAESEGRYKGAWWRSLVRPALQEWDGVEQMGAQNDRWIRREE